MREYPLFVPFGPDHLAAVLTVPDDEPDGLVALLTGGSAARSHRFQIWTRTARRLAEERGLASVRLDWRGTGDSTGALPEWHITEVPVDQVVAVLELAQRATGVARIGVTGNCMGARVALGVAAQMPECVAALCMRTPLLEPAQSQTLDRVRSSGLGRAIRSNPFLRRTIAEPLSRRKKRAGSGVKRAMSSALEHADMLFLYTEEDFTFGPHVRKELDRVVSALPERSRRRYELRVLPGRGLKGFESFDIQRVVIDTVVEWMGERFGRTAPLPEPATAT